MSVGIQSTSQLEGLGLRCRHRLAFKRQLTDSASIRHWMFPDGLLKWNVLPTTAGAVARALASRSPDSATVKTARKATARRRRRTGEESDSPDRLHRPTGSPTPSF
jgi:hypothetical protein